MATYTLKKVFLRADPKTGLKRSSYEIVAEGLSYAEAKRRRKLDRELQIVPERATVNPVTAAQGAAEAG